MQAGRWSNEFSYRSEAAAASDALFQAARSHGYMAEMMTAAMMAANDDPMLAEDLPPESFLWEQISESIDPVELEEVQRVVGNSLVSACTDIYAEVRALREIMADYSADTDELVKKCASMPRSGQCAHKAGH